MQPQPVKTGLVCHGKLSLDPWDFRRYLYLLGSVSHLSFSGSEGENTGFLKAVFYVLLLFSLQQIEQSLEHSSCSSIC